MKYAPVIIPTLNRYEHFRQCLESLERCTGAAYTDVYVGLDFPPADKYIQGWEKINQYLLEKEQDNAFRSLTIFRRSENCGIISPESNFMRLYKHVAHKYETYIYSEDDNVFSPNFLEYINKGLERYKDDDSVFAIVGYAHPYHFKHADNNHYRHNTDMSAWGFGTWVRKYEQMTDYVVNGGFKKDFSIAHLLKFRKHGWLRLFEFIYYAYHNGFTWITDGVISVYMIVHDKVVITPTLSKVRNIGWDVNGNSFKGGMQGLEEIALRHNTQEIDNAVCFEYVGDDTMFLEYNNLIAVRESDGYMSFGQFIAKLWKSFFKLPQ